MVEQKDRGELRDSLEEYNSRILTELCYILGLHRSGTIAKKIQRILDSEYDIDYISNRVNFLIFGLTLVDYIPARDLSRLVRNYGLARYRRKWDNMVEIVRSEEVTPRDLLGELSIRDLERFHYQVFDEESESDREGLTRELIQVFDLDWLNEAMDSGFIMMAMGVDGELENTYQVIKDECERVGINAIRIDEVESSGKITEEVQEMIEESEYLFVDLTYERPNVYYELGYSHGLGKKSEKIVLMARHKTKLHFDIKTMRTIFYKDHDQLRRALRKRLKAIK
jgi:hypothetical protein